MNSNSINEDRVVPVVLRAVIKIPDKVIVDWVSCVLERSGKIVEKFWVRLEIPDDKNRIVSPDRLSCEHPELLGCERKHEPDFFLKIPLVDGEPLVLSDYEVFKLLAEEATYRGYKVSALGGLMKYLPGEVSEIIAELMVDLPERFPVAPS